MKNFNIFVNENIQQAKSFLRKEGLTENDEIYKHIRKITKGKDGYVGWLTKLAYNDLIKNIDVDGVKRELTNIVNNYLSKTQIINLLNIDVVDYTTLEEFIDDFSYAEMLYHAKNIYNKFPRKQKELIDLDDIDDVDFLYQLDLDKKNDIFIKKISSYKNSKDLRNALIRFVTGQVNEGYDKIIKTLNDKNIKITYQNEINDIIICNIKKYEEMKYLGAKTSWCIVGSESTYNNYVNSINELREQYIIYLTDKSNTSNDKMIGITVSSDKILYAHYVNDEAVNTKELLKLLNNRGCTLNMLMPNIKEIVSGNLENYSFDILLNAGLTRDEIISKKKCFTTDEFKEFTKAEFDKYDLYNSVENKFSSRNYVSIKTLLSTTVLTKDDIYSNKKIILWMDYNNISDEDKEKYNLYNKKEIDGSNIIRTKGTVEELSSDDFIYRIEDGSLPLYLYYNRRNVSKEEITNKIDILYPKFNERSKKIYDNYLNVDKSIFKKIEDYKYGHDDYNVKDIDKYDVDDIIMILRWHNVNSSEYTLSEIFSILEIKHTSVVTSLINYLKTNNFSYTDNEIISLMFNSFSHFSSFSGINEDINLLHELYECDIDVKQKLINILYVKNDNDKFIPKYSKPFKKIFNGRSYIKPTFINEDDYVGDTSKYIKEILKNDKDVYDTFLFYEKYFRFREITTLMAGSKTHYGEYNKKGELTYNMWVKECKTIGLTIKWDDNNDGMYGFNRNGNEVLISYVLMLIITDNYEDLQQIQCNWSNLNKDTLTLLSESILGISINNNNTIIDVANDLNEEQRYKLYNFVENTIQPKIQDTDKEFNLQLLYFIWNRNDLARLFKKSSEIENFIPLFNYLLDDYSESFFYKTNRFIPKIDLKYYLKLITKKNKISKTDKHYLIRNTQYTKDSERINTNNTIINQFIAESNNIMNYQFFLLEKRNKID